MSHQIEEPLNPEAETAAADGDPQTSVESAAEAAAEATETGAAEASAEVVAEVTDAAAEASDAVAETADAVPDVAADAAEVATEAAEEATDAVAESAADAAEEAAEAAAEVADAADEAAGAVDEAVTEAVVEASEAAAEASDAAVEEASEAVSEAVEQATEAADEVAEETVAATADVVEKTAEAMAEPAEASTDAAPQEEASKTEAASEGEAAAETTEAAEATEAAAATETAETTEAAEATEAVAAAATTAAPGGEDTEPGETMAMLEKALAEKTLIEGQVIGWNKGGYHVAIGKIAAFCPVSQIEIGNPRSPKRYLDRTFKFQVIEIQQDGRRVVISRANALKTEREQKAALVRERLNVGDKLEGTISSITSFGAFVDLGGGIEGLVHVSELSRRRVEHAKELVKSGQKVNVQVLKIEKGGQRISLSMKRLEKDPWSGVAERFPAGNTFEGKILRKTDFGLFIEVEPGLEGLLHLSRLPLGVTVEDESLEIGKTIQGWIHDVEAKRRRLSLSLREVSSSNPWKGVRDRFPEGNIVTGTVERLARFGVFIELEPGLTGLLPFSTLAGGGNPRRQYHPGKEVSVRVLSIDSDRKRISLGTEQSKAEGSQQDYKDYLKGQKKDSGRGMTAMEAAFAKLKQAGG